MSGKINYNSGWLNPAEVYELRTELAEFKLLEVSLGKRIKNLVSDVNEHEAELAELKTENNMFIEFINRTFGKDADGIIEDLRELKPYKENQYE